MTTGGDAPIEKISSWHSCSRDPRFLLQAGQARVLLLSRRLRISWAHLEQEICVLETNIMCQH